MKVMLGNVAIAPENDAFACDVLTRRWKQNFDLVKDPDTEIMCRFSDWGIIGMEGFFYPAIDTLNAQSVLQQAVKGEKDGYDAVMITCFGDPMLDQIRSLVDIPVTSIGETSYHMAAMMGKKFGLVTVSENNIYESEHTIERYGFREYCAGIMTTIEKPEEQPKALINARSAIESFQEVGRKLIAQGAEILLPGCGLMAAALRTAPGCEKEYPNGVTEVDGVPVMDVLGVTLKMTEMLVRLKKAGSPWISRKGIYRLPTESALESGRMVLADDRQHFWDYPV